MDSKEWRCGQEAGDTEEASWYPRWDHSAAPGLRGPPGVMQMDQVCWIYKKVLRRGRSREIILFTVIVVIIAFFLLLLSVCQAVR